MPLGKYSCGVAIIPIATPLKCKRFCIKVFVFGKNHSMRKRCKTFEEVKSEIASLLGKDVKISINRGRNRSEKYDGTILFAYPNVFILKIKGNELIKSLTVSYNDLICGDARIKS